MNHVSYPTTDAYAWNQSHGYSLNNSVDWQLVNWWSYAYNAMQQGQMVSAWYANTQKEMVLEQEEQDAAEGLLGLSSSSLESQTSTGTSTKSLDDRTSLKDTKQQKRHRLASNYISRSEMKRIFGMKLSLPLKCTVKIEVDGKVLSKRTCEIRGSTTLYMTPYDRASFNGLYEKGLRLDNISIDDNKNVTLVRMFTKNPY